MAYLRCDKCKGSTNIFGSWNTPIKILCKKCCDKEKKPKNVNKGEVNNICL